MRFRNFEDDTKMSDNFQRRPESSLTCPSLRRVSLNATSLPVLSICRKKYCLLHIGLISNIALSLHIFGIYVKQSCNHSQFSIRRENLALEPL